MKHSRNKLLASLLLASAAATAIGHAQTTVGTFTGGDEGEGLDLKGNFTYAVNVSSGGPAGRVGDALFTADNTAGVTVLADNDLPDWLGTNYGDTENDNNLEFVLKSIRWTAAPGNVTVRMNVETGVKYKLQILFAESCCRGRGFDVNVNGALAVDEFIPAAVQGDSLATTGAVVTHEFTASSDTLEFVLDGTTADSAEINDHNPILNGFTLERLTAPGDQDGDGLPDDWEKKFFGNLDAQPGGDADSDGLTNLQEFTRGTSPADDDSDDDGLKDGDEVNTHHSDPLLKDSDGDRVQDGVEVNTYHTDPTKTDSDGDGTNDYDELRLHTNPADKTSVPTATSLGSFTGGDPGEGLDLQGTFPYALNVGGIDPSQAGDALFLPITEAEVTGATLVAGNQVANWYAPAYGDSADDDGIEVVMQSIRWSNYTTDIPAVELTLDSLDIGAEYKLQLLFAESCCAGRAFDIYVNGQMIVDEFNPSIYQGGNNNLGKSAVVTHTFIANAATTVIRLEGRGITTPEFTDHNAIFNGMTLERLAAKVDADGDQLPDAWEVRFFGNTAQTAAGDADGDGISNADEFKNGTNPASADSDGDGLSDSAEKTAGSDAGNPDSDFDGISDGDEVNIHHSNPLSKDTDGDGLSDSMEILTTKTDPAKADSDGDGFDDVTEIFSKTNPMDASSKPRKTVVRPFTGGDEGDGLVFKAQPGGKFLYAVSIGGNPGGVTVGDATFTDETAEGLTVTSGATIASWVAPEFGDSANDDALEQAIVGIRHGPPITVTMTGLQPGGAYRLQLMFFEGCCSRGFDVSVNGEKIADDFAPYVVQGGANNKPKGAGITHRFIATSDTLTVVLEGNTVAVPAYTDHNPILNAATLEEIAPPGDKDGDGLSDPWEIENFGSIAAQDGNGDPDGDGLNNTGEFGQNSDPNNKDSDGDGLTDKEEKDAATNPNSADTDGDGLSDLDEVNKYHTDATKADGDNDGLNDSQEVLIYHTDPAKADTDGDGFPDNWEAFSSTDPADAGSKPVKLLVRPFYGGDAADGLDLDGNFKYAINVGTAGAPSTAGLLDTVRDATFTADDVEGVKITAPNQIANWHAPEYGDTDADNTIEYIAQSMRWSTGPVRADLSGLTPGRTYKLQLLFAESCCSRGFDLRIDGQLIVNDFFIPAVQGGINNPQAGALIAYTFVAGDDTLNIALEGAGVTNPQIVDHNPTLSGITLEDLGNVVLPPASPTVNSSVRTANGFAITFSSEAGRSYTLEYRENAAAGNWTPVSDTVSATGATTTLTDTNAARLAASTGFYRIRAQ